MTNQARKLTSARGNSESACDDFLTVTERGGEWVSPLQVDRFLERYVWASRYCRGKDALEMACGTGPGLGLLHRVSKSLCAGDLSDEVLKIARQHYGDRLRIDQFDAARTPYSDRSFDVIVLFEAIYYLDDVSNFLREVRRLLREDGVLLIAMANKDLFDFNPSPFARAYFGPPELRSLLTRERFRADFYGGSPVADSGLISMTVRMLKRLAARWGMIPRTMRGKRLLKRLVYGRMVRMPRELTDRDYTVATPIAIPGHTADVTHQVLYCVAVKETQ